MAFLSKRKGNYLLGWHVTVPFDPKNPPRTKKGTIPVIVQRAMVAGRNYFSDVRWKSLKVSTKDEAERLLADFESKNVRTKKAAYDDILFSEAIKVVLNVFTSRAAYESRESYVIQEFDKFFAGRYLSSISENDLKRFETQQLSEGISTSRIDRKLTTLRTLYTSFNRARIFKGESPFKYFGLENSDEIDNPREITLEDWQQKRLLWASYDPALHKIYNECRVEVARKFAGNLKLEKWTKFGRQHEYHVELWSAFRKKADRLSDSGYGNNEDDHLRAFEHVKFQTQRKATDCRVLRDLIMLTLTYGPRRGEVVGVPDKLNGHSSFRGGLKVGHWDSVKNILTLVRSKKQNGSVKISEWIVTPFIAELLNRYCSSGRDKDELIFPCTGNNVHTFRNAFLEAVRFAEIQVEVTNRDGMKELVYPQYRDLRHVATGNMIDSGLSTSAVARILGHKSTVMVEKVYNNRLKASTQQNQADLIAKGMERILGPQVVAGDTPGSRGQQAASSRSDDPSQVGANVNGSEVQVALTPALVGSR